MKDTDKKLSVEYMMTRGPWTVFDFPEEYVPFGQYRPPTFLFGIQITPEDFLRYAEKQDLIKSDVDFTWPCRAILHLTKVCGVPVSLQDIYGSDMHYVLCLCSNYNVGQKYPLKEAVILVEELKKAGILVKIRWFLKRTPGEELEPELNWEDEYHRAAESYERRLRARK
ncbi:hypothetical protein VKT23_011131 [Stygiomarasmius scandens]|uniref:Uncharacterized protein n=1 Tax=Marasmiellus scandens TaxID=2682957 RepID=A0ABR1JAK4_9AGAR